VVAWGKLSKNGENSFLVPVRDADFMARAIRNFIDMDEINKKNIIYNARETIKQNHLLSNQIDQFKSFYNRMM